MSSINKRLTVMGILALLAVAIVLVVQFVDLGKNEDETAEEDASASVEQIDPLFPEAAFDTATSIYVEDMETGDAFSAESDEEGAWTIVEAVEGSDTGLGVDEPRLSSALLALPTITPTRVLSDIETLAVYGLREPKYTIKFGTASGGEYSFFVGEANPGDTAYYVKLFSSSTTVYLLSKYNIDALADFIENPPFIQPLDETDDSETS